MPARVEPRPRFLTEFLVTVLVRCPRCGAAARSVSLQADAGAAGARRLSCLACGYTRDTEGGRLSLFRDGRDPHFGEALWLTTPCCGETLWAYDAAHLAFLEAFVGARHRTRRRSGVRWSNGSLQSRLPRWLKDAKNRQTVLEAIARLRRTLPEGLS